MSDRFVVTSLSPHLLRGRPSGTEAGQDYQKRCVRSWLEAGARVVSINNAVEIALLQDAYRGVEFVKSAVVQTAANPKRLPFVSEMLAFGDSLSSGSTFAIANSDVEFRGDEQVLDALFEAAENGVVYANRFERAVGAYEPALPYLYGYDFMICDNRFASSESLTSFAIGAPWWDYLILYLFAAQDVPLRMVASPVISHSTHEQAWSVEAWTRGLGIVARRIREFAAEEGPAAALLGYLCRSLEPGVAPSFLMQDIRQQLGTALGTAMVAYIAERTVDVLWFDLVDDGDGRAPRGALRRARHAPALEVVGALA